MIPFLPHCSARLLGGGDDGSTNSAIAFMVIGFALDDAMYLLIAGLLASGAILGWAVQAVRKDELDRDRK
ncbi:MAG: hypothetical protein ACRDTX_27240 [Pseudonocardiaceae bacterium]